MAFNIVEVASVRAPVIIAVAIVAAVAGAWSNAPHWPFYALTVALLLLAAVVWARRGLARQLKSKEQLGFRRNRDWLGFEFLAKGTPRGYYALAFVSWFAVVLTGLRFPYAAVAIAGMMLTVAWGGDRRRYPADPRQDALTVAKIIRAFLDGSGGKWDWDDFTSCSRPSAELDSIRRRAGAVDLPVGPEERIALEALAEEAERLASR